VDRHAPRRTEPGLLEHLRTLPTTRVLRVAGPRVPLAPSDDAAPPRLAYCSPALLTGQDLEFYLGSGDGIDYLGALVDPTAPSEPDPQVSWLSLREVAALLPDLDAGLAVAAVALGQWHVKAGFCAVCGSPTDVEQAGWVRRCRAQGHEVFPRMDPAVIVAVTDDEDRLLLARARHFAAGRFSVLAGYVDAGESLEAAVRREIGEEVGIGLSRVRYLGSQAWPFPASLMCAFEARAESTDLVVDPTELAEARWFSRAEFAGAIADGTVKVAPRSAIARSQIERWYGQGLDLP
jgi:NAD+ diphosphatase